MRGGLPILRPDPKSTPCWSCPKKSPAEAKQHELTDRNFQTVQLYLQCEATGFRFLPAHQLRDPILGRNFAIIRRIMAAYQSEQSSLNIAEVLGSMLKAPPK